MVGALTVAVLARHARPASVWSVGLGPRSHGAKNEASRDTSAHTAGFAIHPLQTRAPILHAALQGLAVAFSAYKHVGTLQALPSTQNNHQTCPALHAALQGFAVAFSAYTRVGPVMAAAIAMHNIPEGIMWVAAQQKCGIGGARARAAPTV